MCGEAKYIKLQLVLDATSPKKLKTNISLNPRNFGLHCGRTPSAASTHSLLSVFPFSQSLLSAGCPPSTRTRSLPAKVTYFSTSWTTCTGRNNKKGRNKQGEKKRSIDSRPFSTTKLLLISETGPWAFLNLQKKGKGEKIKQWWKKRINKTQETITAWGFVSPKAWNSTSGFFPTFLIQVSLSFFKKTFPFIFISCLCGVFLAPQFPRVLRLEGGEKKM